MKRYFQKSKVGFTLAELLIALVILGEIATFTIPKIITSQANARKNAMTKEVSGILASAFQTYATSQQLTSSTTPGVLISYLNYVKVDSSTVIDDAPTFSSQTCGSNNTLCLKLHNGGILQYSQVATYTTPSSTWIFIFDPDGSYGGSSSGDSKSVRLELFQTGRLTTTGILVNSMYDPSWLKW